MGQDLDKCLDRCTGTVDLHDEQIAELPIADMVEASDAIQQLWLGRNELRCLPLKFVSLRRLRVLDLSHNHLTDFPRVVLELPSLNRLDVSANRIPSLPEVLPRAQQLITLLVGRNPITELPPCFTAGSVADVMPNLKTIFIDELHLDIATILPQNRGVVHGAAFQRVPQEIVSGLFLGSKFCLRDGSLLRARGITHVLSLCASPCPELPYFMRQKHVEVPNGKTADLRDILPAACSFIGLALNTQGRVLVHCDYGVTVSPSVVAAFLIHSPLHRLECAAAVALIQQRRYCVCPTPALLSQLEQFQALQNSDDTDGQFFRSPCSPL